MVDHALGDLTETADAHEILEVQFQQALQHTVHCSVGRRSDQYADILILSGVEDARNEYDLCVLGCGGQPLARGPQSPVTTVSVPARPRGNSCPLRTRRGPEQSAATCPWPLRDRWARTT